MHKLNQDTLGGGATTVYVSQDGATFFCTAERDDYLVEQDAMIITYPARVTDFDMLAAKRAREWFQRHCREHGIRPVFD